MWTHMSTLHIHTKQLIPTWHSHFPHQPWIRVRVELFTRPFLLPSLTLPTQERSGNLTTYCVCVCVTCQPSSVTITLKCLRMKRGGFVHLTVSEKKIPFHLQHFPQQHSIEIYITLQTWDFFQAWLEARLIDARFLSKHDFAPSSKHESESFSQFDFQLCNIIGRCIHQKKKHKTTECS